MAPELGMLAGEALAVAAVEGGGGPAGANAATPALLRAFPVAGLPRDPAARFAALFRERPRWEWAALEPYTAGLQGPGQTAEALLLKYARASQARPADPVTYSAR